VEENFRQKVKEMKRIDFLKGGMQQFPINIHRELLGDMT
jgi:hypothetical protein